MNGLLVDLFAGAGGASVGIEAALGRAVDVAVNHDATAVAVHEANHPHTLHLRSDVWDVDPVVATGGRQVELLWASPDCRHFSRAKGDVPKSPRVRSLAWVVVRWAKAARPRVILLENVQEFRTWGPLGPDGKPIRARAGETFDEWVHALQRLGYQVEDRVLDASLYGAPTRRRRLFVVARRDGEPIAWPAPTHGPGRAALRTAAECIDWSMPCPSIFDRKRPLAPATLRRVAEGIRRFVLGATDPFVVTLRGTEDSHVAASASSTGEPLRTVSAGGTHHAIVAPTLVQTGQGERDGQSPRVADLHEPLGTVVAGGAKRALVAAFLAHHYGGEAALPLGVVTARDHHSLVAASLVSYYGTGTGQRLDNPLRTATTKDRFALVEAFLRRHCVGSPDRNVVRVGGAPHVIVDIGLRMLEPHELLRAQFGPHAARFDLSAAKSKASKIRLVGNSVAPQVAEALVRANLRGGKRAPRQLTIGSVA